MMKHTITILLTLLVLFPSAYAATVEDSIIGLYVAYYNRAPDIEGFNHWKTQADKNGNTTALKAISRGFEAAPQFSTEYPSTLSNEDFVKKIYQNILDRDPDLSGWNYWVDRLDNGLSKSDFIIEYVNTVLNFTSDSEEGKKSTAMFNNKLTVSKAFMNTLKNASNGGADTTAYKRSIEVLSSVTEDSGTVTSAQSKITQYCDEVTTECTASSGAKNYNLTLKDSASASKQCVYDRINWKEDGTLEVTLKDFDSCF